MAIIGGDMKKKGGSRFCRLVKEAIADETKAPKDYSKVAQIAPTKQMAAAINRIAAQERKHKQKLERMYRNHCRGGSR